MTRRLSMKKVSVLLMIAAVLAFGAFVGCSSGDGDEAATGYTETVDKAEDVAAKAEETAVDLASFDNPEEGVCPVCKMKVEAAYVEVAEIDEKKYACCSARCVAMLIETPDKYLTADATGHEGHGHDGHDH
jgi:hypothetical protein